MSTRGSSKQRVLVTGGAGFLGRHICEQLVAKGKYVVTVFDVRDVSVEGCDVIVGNLAEASDVSAAVRGQDIVLHTATAAPTASNAATGRKIMQQVNVVGTVNVINACLEHNVSRLIYTSSASVVFEGKALVDIDESHPYAQKPMDFYTGTKMEAEKLVLKANSERLATCALRPSGIFGPGNDNLLVPGVVDRARTGKLKYGIGDGKNVFDWTYVGNVAHAHLCAAEKLDIGSPAAGEPFFITNDEPSGFWEMIGDLAQGLGYDRPSIFFPVWLMMIFAHLVTFLGQVFGFQSDLNPMRVRVASVQRTMSCDKAKRLLEYAPVVGMKKGKILTIAHFQHLHCSRQEESVPVTKAD